MKKCIISIAKQITSSCRLCVIVSKFDGEAQERVQTCIVRGQTETLTLVILLPGIERVKHAMLLGVDVSDTLSTAAYVNRLLMKVNQRLYLLSLLQSSSLQCPSLHLLVNTCVINKLTYTLPAYAGQLTADDKNRINAMSRKAMRRGLTLTAFDIDTLIHKSDSKLFQQVIKPGH